MSQLPFLPASTTLPAASNTMSCTGTPSRRPSSRARSTEMPAGSAPGVAGRCASTALPTLIAARSVPFGASSFTAFVDEQPPRRRTRSSRRRMLSPHVLRILEVRRRVDDEHAHLLRGGLETMRRVRRKEAGFPRAHLELLAGYLDVRAAFEEIAHLLDAGMRVRQRAFAPLDLAEHHLEVAALDEPKVARAGVVGRRIRLEFRGPDQVFHRRRRTSWARPSAMRISGHHVDRISRSCRHCRKSRLCARNSTP